MLYEIVGEITQIETIAVGSRIRELPRIRRLYGRGRWRKLKGVALAMSTKRRKPRRRPVSRFAVCIENTGYPASLELHKIYRIIPDADAARDGDVRIVDESGEDYLYPAEWFAGIDPPRRVKISLLRGSTQLQSA